MTTAIDCTQQIINAIRADIATRKRKNPRTLTLDCILVLAEAACKDTRIHRREFVEDVVFSINFLQAGREISLEESEHSKGKLFEEGDLRLQRRIITKMQSQRHKN